MTADTQWPRFEAFQQRRPEGQFHNVGSVHAADAEMALQNARDVFVRRPQTVSLWVVPTDAILARTREELESDPAWREPQEGQSAATPETYHVFQKRSQRRSMHYVSHVGDVQASTAGEALQRAWEQFGGERVFVWWIVPAAAVVRSNPDEAASLFEPAQEKGYRLPGAYHTRTLMREASKRQDEQ